MTIKNIVFDFGGVLIDWNPRYFYNGVFGDPKKADDFIKNICTAEWNAQMDAGRTFAECIAELQQEHPEYAHEIGLYFKGWTKMISGPIPEGVEMLKALHASGKFNLYGLTNWSAETIGWARQTFDFLQLFKLIVVSGEERLIKPEPLLYQRMLFKTQSRACETLFIDDNIKNVRAARAMGITAVHLKDGDFAAAKAEIEQAAGFKF